MTNPSLDAAAVQSLVAEVLRRVNAAQLAPHGASGSAAGPVALPASSAAVASTITERVITLAHLERIPAGVRQIVIHASAVITPSARDRAKELGVVLVRSAQPAPAPAAGRPFIIAQAACRTDASTRAAAIARAIPHAQQLPTSGLADVITALAGHVSKDAARGVLLTGRPAVAVILANRSASLRAVTARDAASLVAAATDAAANLLVVDPAAFQPVTLERLCGDFHRTPSPSVPVELAAAPAGCGCKGHAH